MIIDVTCKLSRSTLIERWLSQSVKLLQCQQLCVDTFAKMCKGVEFVLSYLALINAKLVN